MKRLLCLVVLFASLAVHHSARAQVPLGTLVTTFPYNPSRLLADPARNRVYAAVPDSNGVVVIDTATLQVVSVVPTGQKPVDMAISPDGNTLYVANAGDVPNPGALAGAVGVLDLNTLTLRASYGLPGPASAIAAGLDGRVYVTAISDEGQTSTICQLDSATGTIQTTVADVSDNSGRLQITPDGTTLFDATTYDEPGSLFSFDVSTPTPTALQTLSRIEARGEDMVISHNGKYLGLSISDDNTSPIQTQTFLLSTADLTTNDGAIGPYDSGVYPGVMDFSPDDSLVYQITSTFPAPSLDVFDAQTSSKLDEVTVPTIDTVDYGDKFASMVVENTGSYVFIADSDFNGISTTGRILVLGTGKGTLTPTPSVTLTATVPNVTCGSGETGEFTLTLSIAPVSDVTVAYTVKGSATAGTDYIALKGTAKIKAGRTSKVIKITPEGDLDGATKKTVVLTLATGSGYTVQTTSKVKAKILAAGE